MCAFVVATLVLRRQAISASVKPAQISSRICASPRVSVGSGGAFLPPVPSLAVLRSCPNRAAAILGAHLPGPLRA